MGCNQSFQLVSQNYKRQTGYPEAGTWRPPTHPHSGLHCALCCALMAWPPRRKPGPSVLLSREGGALCSWMTTLPAVLPSSSGTSNSRLTANALSSPLLTAILFFFALWLSSSLLLTGSLTHPRAARLLLHCSPLTPFPQGTVIISSTHLPSVTERKKPTLDFLSSLPPGGSGISAVVGHLGKEQAGRPGGRGLTETAGVGYTTVRYTNK